jgi:hypothetical protein
MGTAQVSSAINAPPPPGIAPIDVMPVVGQFTPPAAPLNLPPPIVPATDIAAAFPGFSPGVSAPLTVNSTIDAKAAGLVPGAGDLVAVQPPPGLDVPGPVSSHAPGKVESAPQTTGVVDVPGPASPALLQITASGVLIVSPGKSPIGSPQTPRDPLLSQVVQFLNRDDRPSQQQVAFASTAGLSSTARDDTALQRLAPLFVQQSPDRRDAERAMLAAIPSIESGLFNFDTRPISSGMVQALPHAALDFSGAHLAMLTGPVATADASKLPLSINDFFDKIDQLGMSLSDDEVDLLYAVGILAAAAGVAGEIIYRQIRSARPALVCGRGPIPYSTTRDA